MVKTGIRFAAQAAVTTVIFGVILWLFEIAFGKEPLTFIEIALQSALFGILMTAYNWWRLRRRQHRQL